MNRVMKYEFRRLFSLRSTWVVFALVVLEAVGISWLIATTFSLGGTTQYIEYLTVVQAVFIPFLMILIAIPAAQTFGHDYRHGTIRLSLSLFPKRATFYVGRMAALLLWVTVLLVASVGSSHLTFMTQRSNVTYEASKIVQYFPRIALYAFFMVIVVTSLSILFRSLPISLVVPLLQVTFLEFLISGLASLKFENVPDYMPFLNLGEWVSNVDASVNLLFPVMIYSGLLFIGAVTKFLKQDA